ncbi:TlpA family protein disulfide reductase [Pedobacter sp. PWIIR3]
MKNNVSQLSIGLVFLLLLTSCGNKTTLNTTTKGYDYNTVISVFPTPNSTKPLVVKSLKKDPVLEVKFDNKGYGKLVLSADGDKSFWIYLDNSTQDLYFDSRQSEQYPVISSSSKESEEIIEYYKLAQHMTRDLIDSVDKAMEDFNNSTSETVTKQTARLDLWREKRENGYVDITAAFAKRHPKSYFTLLLIEERGLEGHKSKDYLNIVEGLDPELKKNDKYKEVSKELNRVLHLEKGAKMAPIAGKDLLGKPFDPKILKKVNVFICWLSYEPDSRKNNIKLIELYQKYKDTNVEFIGVSFDEKEKWWRTVVKDDKLIWPQYSDLVGTKSPNAANLSNYIAPYMFITDKSGVILQQDVSIDGLDLDIETCWTKR